MCMDPYRDGSRGGGEGLRIEVEVVEEDRERYSKKPNNLCTDMQLNT